MNSEHDRQEYEGQAVDPVCGMRVNPQQAAGSVEYHGTTYFFCAVGCAEKFKVDPERYLKPKAAAPIGIQRASKGPPATHASPMTGGQIEYTCPMHPEIVRGAPGSCPRCGMALEPRTISLADEANPELVDMSRRFWVSLALSLPLLPIAMSEMLPGNPVMR